MSYLAVLLVLCGPGDDRTLEEVVLHEYVDVVELNWIYSWESCEPRFYQLIYWRIYGDGKYHAVSWSQVDEKFRLPCVNQLVLRVGERTVVVHFLCRRVRRTFYDPERADLEELPINLRDPFPDVRWSLKEVSE